MGEVVKFPRNTKPLKEYDVFVTFIVPWKGNNGEEAAMDAARNISLAAEHVAEFHGPARLLWGKAKKRDLPKV